MNNRNIDTSNNKDYNNDHNGNGNVAENISRKIIP